MILNMCNGNLDIFFCLVYGCTSLAFQYFNNKEERKEIKFYFIYIKELIHIIEPIIHILLQKK